MKIIPSQTLPRHFSPECINRLGRFSLRDRRDMAVLDAQLGKGIFRQAQLIAAHDGRIVNHIQGGQNAATIGTNFHFG